MISQELVQRLKNFFEGDVIERTSLVEEIKPLCFKQPPQKGKLASMLKSLWTHMDSLPFQEPIEPMIRSLGDFFESYYGLKPFSSKEERIQEIKELVHRLKQLYKGEKVPLPREEEESSESSDPSSMVFSFTEEDEAKLDYSGIVTEDMMLNSYITEGNEFLDSAQSALLDLEHDPQDPEAINQVFRCFHTLKSSSAFLGFKNVEVLAHQMENMLGKVRDYELSINAELIDIIFHGMGIIRDLVKVIELSNGRTEAMIDGFQSYKLTPYIQLIEQIVESSKKKKIGEILQELGRLDNKTLKKILKTQEQDSRIFGEIALENKAVSREDLDEALQEQAKQKIKQKTQSSVRVSSGRLSMLVDMVGELVVNQSMIREKIHNGEMEVSEQDVNQLESITTTIKDIVLSMGMVPMDEMFQKLRVVVRNTARELNKNISFQISGEDTEMDRNLVEAIYDPLVHMVRNSVSHGIELPDDREKMGKPRVGNIIVSARYRGNGIEIEVSDDGGGIAKEKVVDKAISLGLIDSDQREMILVDDQAVFSLLFKPGFSTREKADNISGRGVGMDVVMQNISQINGKVDIQSEAGKGTTFRIKLPLTLAIIDGFVTEIHGEFYVFPFDTIEEILVPNEVTLIPTEDDSPMIKVRDQYYALLDLQKLLIGTKGEYQERFVYIHVRYDDKDLAIPVNRVLGKQEIVIKNLNELVRRQHLFSGGTIFGDGSIGFILDLEEIVQSFQNSTYPEIKKKNVPVS